MILIIISLIVLLTALLVVLVLGQLVDTQRHDGRLGGETIVRCQAGHLFTTIWIPGISFKAVRLGSIRFQKCPVGDHWTLIALVDESTLTEDEKQIAYQNRDNQIP